VAIKLEAFATAEEALSCSLHFLVGVAYSLQFDGFSKDTKEFLSVLFLDEYRDSQFSQFSQLFRGMHKLDWSLSFVRSNIEARSLSSLPAY
jgi:hypothetical protein